ncbi:glutamyl-tRNA amidotransferase [Rhodobacteraceae bacterium WD3A24]|nr:glutamyl-tRNA amidotransferase [Rhodobacteraceae bacterium WD3A24]
MVEKSSVANFWPSIYEPLRQFGTRMAELVAPASEASSGDDAYRISLELPGVSEDDIELTVEGGVVSVKGEKKTEREERSDTWYFSERQYGAFSRSFRLPDDADEDAVKADLKDGVLNITIPRKAAAKGGGKRVEIGKG